MTPKRSRLGRRRREDAVDGMTQAAVARALGLSRARIMQIERAALLKLRRALGAAGLRECPLFDRGHWSDLFGEAEEAA